MVAEVYSKGQVDGLMGSVGERIEAVASQLPDTSNSPIATTEDVKSISAVPIDSLKATDGKGAGVTEGVVMVDGTVSIVSLEDGNILEFNIGGVITQETWTAGQVKTFSMLIGDRVKTLNNKGFDGNHDNGGKPALARLGYSGKKFEGVWMRNTNGSGLIYVLASFGSAVTITTDIFFGGGLVFTETFVLPAGSSIKRTYATASNASTSNPLKLVVSTNEPIVMFATGNNNATDGRIVPALSAQLVGFNSNNARISSVASGAIARAFLQDGEVQDLTLADSNLVYNLVGSGSDQSESSAHAIYSDNLISATTVADTDGLNAYSYHDPDKCMAHLFGLPTEAEHLTFGSFYKGKLWRFDTRQEFLDGNPTVTYDFARTNPNAGSNVDELQWQPCAKKVGTDSEADDIPAGTLFLCEYPAWCVADLHNSAPNTDADEEFITGVLVKGMPNWVKDFTTGRNYGRRIVAGVESIIDLSG